MALIIAEKPKVAKKIAEFLSRKNYRMHKFRKAAYYSFCLDGKKYYVISALGHLYTLSSSSKKWDYPIFDYNWVPAYYEDKIYAKKDYIELAKKFKGEKEIIVATDYDIEGELIGYNVIRFALEVSDAKRMIFSAITPKDIWNSFLNLQDTISFSFAIAGETRHIVDWIYGINLSRALTHAIRHYSKKVVLSIGRVQGPTLKLIFEREVEIRNFVPDEFFTIIAEVYKDGKILRFRHLKERFRTKEEALREKSKIGKFITIKQVNAFLEKINPPVPYNLTDLQTDAYKYYKITPKQTLTIAQSLYEQGYISYPRTSSQKLPDTIDFRYILSNLQKILSYKTFASSLLNKSILKPYNGKKDDVHPAIHPTGLIPSKLSQNEWKIYDLICRRFLSCFFEPARVRKLRVITEEGLFFDYKSVLHKGWLSVYWRWVKDDFSNFEFEKGESLQVKRVSVRKQKTKPPSRYNPASIVKKMEELNIGTKATRAEIVQILYKRKYIEGKSIKITDLGERIVSLFDKYLPEILDVQLTRRLERDLELIERGKIELRDKVIETVKEVVRNVCLEIKEREKEIGKSLYEVYKKL